MKSLMILLATMAMLMIAVQAEIVHPALDEAKVMETNTPVATEDDTNGTEVTPEEK